MHSSPTALVLKRFLQVILAVLHPSIFTGTISKFIRHLCLRLLVLICWTHRLSKLKEDSTKKWRKPQFRNCDFLETGYTRDRSRGRFGIILSCESNFVVHHKCTLPKLLKPRRNHSLEIKSAGAA